MLKLERERKMIGCVTSFAVTMGLYYGMSMLSLPDDSLLSIMLGVLIFPGVSASDLDKQGDADSLKVHGLYVHSCLRTTIVASCKSGAKDVSTGLKESR